LITLNFSVHVKLYCRIESYRIVQPYLLPKSQVNHHQQILQNCLVRTAIKLNLLDFLISHLSSNPCTGSSLTNAYKLLSHAYKVLMTSQPNYLQNMISASISVQSIHV